MSRISHLFHSSTANVCPTGAPASSSASSPNKAPATGGAASPSAGADAGAQNGPVAETLLNPRENIRELIQELIKEAETNPACEGVRRRLNSSESTNPSTIVHTIGSYLPVPLHDFLKDLVDRLHKLTRRAEDACTQNPPSAANASSEPSALSRVCPTAPAPAPGSSEAAPAPPAEAPASPPPAAAAAGPTDEAAPN